MRTKLMIALLVSITMIAVTPFLAAAKGPGGGNKPPSGETAANNVSFPVILSDGVGPTGFPLNAAWRFATVDNVVEDCIGEEGVVPGDTVPTDNVCYYGRHTTTIAETGELVFDGDPMTWWLQQRPQNFWKVFTFSRTDAVDNLAVSAVDVGDLLESTPAIQTRQIRTEFNLLQNVPAGDAEMGAYVVPAENWTNLFPSPCEMPAASNQYNLGCFAAVQMSGAVPGTEQTINETQGTNFGPGTCPAGINCEAGTGMLLDPTALKTATPTDGTDPFGIHAIVYSRCARLLIQKISNNSYWEPAEGQWCTPGATEESPPDCPLPAVNIAAYNSDAYSAEINSGGGVVYGYNWNAKDLAVGAYRLTFVLDGNDDTGPKCSTPLRTTFDSSVTKLVNVGENNKPEIIFAGGTDLNGGDEGGMVYIDLNLTGKGGGKKRQ